MTISLEYYIIRIRLYKAAALSRAFYITARERFMDYKVRYENWISSEYLCSEGVAELKKIIGVIAFFF